MDLHDDRPFTLQLVALDGEAVAVTAAPTSTGRQLRQQLLAQLGPRPGRRIGWMQRGEDEVELTKTLKDGEKTKRDWNGKVVGERILVLMLVGERFVGRFWCVCV